MENQLLRQPINGRDMHSDLGGDYKIRKEERASIFLI